MLDRSESIRRAEEMLSQFMKESVEQSSKRPEFLKNRRAPQIPQLQVEPVYVDEESVKISFVQDQINKIDFKTTLDMH
jgi:hypothetical protein